jgi:uncharacterized protein
MKGMKREKRFQGRQIKKAFSLVLFLCLLWISPILSQSLPKVPLYIKDKEIWVEVAKTDADRAKGLMERTSLGKEEGMLFIFENEGTHGFWMKNTLLPLSIAFMDKEGKIVWITDMKPGTLFTHQPPKPILYALEMNQGWFAANGIRAGDVMRFSK